MHRNVRGDNVLHLFHVQFVSQPQRMCYMLFPLIAGGSLRDEVSKRKLLSDNLAEVRPFSERQVLVLFKGVLEGVKAMHAAGYAHCDVKLENVLLDKSANTRDEEMKFASRPNCVVGSPILMDFGSARNLVIKLNDRRTVLNLTEEAAQHSTISCRAPELFDGGCRHGPLEADICGKIDVWSSGCLLYGLMYGTSPFEMEFRHDGSVRVVECTHLRVLGGKVQFPSVNRESIYKYRQETHELVEWILAVDRTERPSIDEVRERVESMLTRRSTGLRDLV